MSRNELDIMIHTLGLPISGEDPVELSLGGSETAAVSMARALQNLGHTVTVSCVTGKAHRVAGVTYIPAEDLMAHNKGREYDVFLSCRFHEVLEQPITAKLIGLWNHDMPSDTFAEDARCALSKASFLFFISEFQKKEYEKFLSEISAMRELTSNGFDFAALSRPLLPALEPVSEPVSESAGLRFIYGSRPERGLDFLLREAWPAIRADFPEAELVVTSYDVSSPDVSESIRGCFDAYRDYYKSCVELIASTPGVSSPGSLTRRQFWTELAACRAVLYPTDFPETSCLVALEAQALGIPIVTTGRFALRETVGFKDTLVRQPWGSAEYLKNFLKTVRRLVKDDAFFDEARQTGLHHVNRESHSWDSIAEQWTIYFSKRLARLAGRAGG